ncbi:MAG: amidohydrolase family protein [Parvularculaceae bacterium]
MKIELAKKSKACLRLSALPALAFAAAFGAAQAQTVFTNVHVVTTDGRGVIEDQTVAVEGDRITAVSGAAAIPDGATVIDGAGRYLTPGLAEMHGHIPPLSAGDDAVNDTLFLYVSNGVTTVRGMLGSEGQLSLREDALEGRRLSPTLYLAGPSFNGNSISSPAQAAERVRQHKAEGWDLLKIHPGLTLAEYNAIDETADEVGIDFGGHVPQAVGVMRALEARQRTIDHLDGYIAYLNGEDRPVADDALRRVARATRDAGVGVVPTSSLWATIIGAADLDELMERDELRYMPAQTVENWRRNVAGRSTADPAHNENRRRLLKAMADEGVEILFGTDAPQIFSVPGFSIHHEIAEMRAAGLTPAQILHSATGAVGAYFADKDRFGAIEPGHRADFLLTAGNPLEDLEALREPDGVMLRGRWLDREEIDRRLAEVAARARR